MSIVKYLFSILIHQNTKSTTDLNIYSILKERPKTFLKMFPIDVNRLKLTRRPHDVIFGQIFKNAFLYRCFCNADYRSTYRYVGKHVEENIKSSFYICIKFVERRPKNVWKMSSGGVHIMMFYGHPGNVNLTHSIKFITITFLKYSFSVPPGRKNNRVYPMSHKCWRNVPRTS